MHQIDSTFIKLDDDETCALLKPTEHLKRPGISQAVQEILNVFHQYPEIRKRVVARLGLHGYTSLE
jgi:hypothetical protein